MMSVCHYRGGVFGVLLATPIIGHCRHRRHCVENSCCASIKCKPTDECTTTEVVDFKEETRVYDVHLKDQRSNKF